MVEARNNHGIELAQAERETISSNAYQIRILTGQFDSGIPFDQRLAVPKLEQNRAAEAFGVIHRKWNGVRHSEWEGDTRTQTDKVQAWASGRADALFDVLHKDQVDEDLIGGLKIIGLNIDNLQVITKESLTSFFAGDFYSNFAGRQGRSVDNLANAFFESAIENGNITEENATKIMQKFDALESLLKPILEGEQYFKLSDVLVARFNNITSEISITDGNAQILEQDIEDLAYFAEQTRRGNQRNNDRPKQTSPLVDHPDNPNPGDRGVEVTPRKESRFRALFERIKGPVPNDRKYHVPDNISVRTADEWAVDTNLMVLMRQGRPKNYFEVLDNGDMQTNLDAAPYAELDKYPRARNAEKIVDGSGVVALAAISNPDAGVQGRVLENVVNALLAAYDADYFKRFLDQQLVMQREVDGAPYSAWTLYQIFEFNKIAAKSPELGVKRFSEYQQKLVEIFNRKEFSQLVDLTGKLGIAVARSAIIPSIPENEDMLFVNQMNIPGQRDLNKIASILVFPLVFNVQGTVNATTRRVEIMKQAILEGKPLTTQQLKYIEFLANAYNIMPVIEKLQTKTEKGKTLSERINRELEEAKGQEAKYEMTNLELYDYLSTLTLPKGVKKIKKIDTSINPGQLAINLAVDTEGGDVTLFAKLIEDAQRGVIVDPKSVKTKIPMKVKIFAPEAVAKINAYIGNIDNELKKLIDSQINQAWQTSSFYITANKLGIRFKKK